VASLLLFSPAARVQPAQPASPELQVLQRHVLPPVASGTAAVTGPLPLTQRLNFVIHLPVRNPAPLANLLKRLSDPRSPDFRHWLSVTEFTAQFGRTPQEYQKVVDFARGNGFGVGYTSPNRLLLVASGSVEQIQKAFHVNMNLYQQPGEDRAFYSPDREPSVALDVPVSHISGLNNLYRPHPAVRRARDGGGPGTGTGSGPLDSFLGSDMRAAYNMGTNTGSGQSVGLVEFAGYATSDISLYFSRSQQTNAVPIVNVAVDGGSVTSYTNPADNDEVCLDIEQAASVAPGLSQLLVYIGPENFGAGVDGVILSRMATDNIAKQLSNSWWWYPDDPGTDEPYFQEMAAQGQSFFSISGDFGAYTGSDATDESYPGEDAYVTSVGATQLTTNGPGGAWQSETVWNGGSDASGGGPANDGPETFPIQIWQAPVINSSNGGSNTTRNVPDVALEGDTDSFECSNSGQCLTNFGGTSASSPRWAAWMALVNEEMVANGHAAGLGFINPALYAIGRSPSYSNDFHDITVGSNNIGRQAGFFAVPGYDLTTGWGSMNGLSLMADLISVGSSTFSLASSSGQITVSAGNSASTTITVTPKGGFKGKVILTASGLPTGVTAVFATNPTTGTSLLTLSASSTATTGTTTATITGTSGGLTATTKLTMTVQAAPGFTLTDSPAAVVVVAGSSGTSTVAVTPTRGFSGKVTLAASGLPSGVTAAFAANPTKGTSLLTLTASSVAAPGTATVTITGTSGSLKVSTKLALTIQSFTLSGSPSTLTLIRGGSATSTVTVLPVGGFGSKVSLATSGLPNGVTSTFATNPATGSSLLTLKAAANATTGLATITISGTAGNLTRTTRVALTVQSFNLSESTSTLAVPQDGIATSTITVVPVAGFSGKVTLSATGLPNGITGTFAPNPTTGTSVLTLKAGPTAGTGTAIVTISGTSGTLTEITKLTLAVQAFSLSESASAVTITPGASGTDTVSVLPLGGFSGKVALSVAGLPTGVTASFSTNPTSKASVLTFKANATATAGTMNLTVTGTSGSLIETTKLTLTVQSFNLSDTLTVIRGGSASTTITVIPLAGFSGRVELTASGLPRGVAAVFATNPTTGPSLLTLRASTTAAIGMTTIVITGTSDGIKVVSRLPLTVLAQTSPQSE
jgi:subtilase family serine protease